MQGELEQAAGTAFKGNRDARNRDEDAQEDRRKKEAGRQEEHRLCHIREHVSKLQGEVRQEDKSLDDKIPECWEELVPKKVIPKVRRPPITNWFRVRK